MDVLGEFLKDRCRQSPDSYIKNYERDDGLAFMEKVYRPSQNHQKQEERKEGTAKNLTPNLPQNEKRESA